MSGENSAVEVEEQKSENSVVRFRRWIAMTPDGNWREFRGTPGMVNIGESKSLLDVVDNMISARQKHFEQMSAGWEVLRKGLTTRNADWIYSEMMTSMDSLHQFELLNFSESNEWTHPQPREQFPIYLSDLPVRDGETSQKPENGEKNHLKMLFGDFIPEKFTAKPASPPKPTSSPQKLRRRLCHGFGFNYNANGDGEVTITSLPKYRDPAKPKKQAVAPTNSGNGNHSGCVLVPVGNMNNGNNAMTSNPQVHDTTISAQSTSGSASLHTDSGIYTPEDQDFEFISSAFPPIQSESVGVPKTENVKKLKTVIASPSYANIARNAGSGTSRAMYTPMRLTYMVSIDDSKLDVTSEQKSSANSTTNRGANGWMTIQNNNMSQMTGMDNSGNAEFTASTSAVENGNTISPNNYSSDFPEYGELDQHPRKNRSRLRQNMRAKMHREAQMLANSDQASTSTSHQDPILIPGTSQEGDRHERVHDDGMGQSSSNFNPTRDRDSRSD